MRTGIEHRPPNVSQIAALTMRLQVLASTNGGVQVHAPVSDGQLMTPLTAAEAAELRLPVPKNMVQAVRVAPSLSGAEAGSSVADARGARALRMVVNRAVTLLRRERERVRSAPTHGRRTLHRNGPL